MRLTLVVDALNRARGAGGAGPPVQVNVSPVSGLTALVTTLRRALVPLVPATASGMAIGARLPDGSAIEPAAADQSYRIALRQVAHRNHVAPGTKGPENDFGGHRRRRRC